MRRRKTKHERKLKPFRVDKRIPQDSTITIEEDYGDRKSIETITAATFRRERHDIPKQSTGEWLKVAKIGSIKISKLVKSDRIFMWDKEIYLGEFSEVELYLFATRILDNIGAFVDIISKQYRGKKYVKRTLLSFSKFNKKIL
jgi:hypothetical protein